MADAQRPRKKKGTPPAPDAAAELRQEAEDRLAGLSAAAAAAAAAAASPLTEDPASIAHELRVHQIELEMMNEELRRSQLALQESYEKYFERFDLAPVGYLTMSAAGVVTDANQTAARLLGVKRQELVGKSFNAYVFPADQEIYYRQRLKLAEHGRAVDFELRLKHGSEPIWVSLQGEPMDANEDEPLRIHLTFADVTERRRAEAALAESELLHRRFLDQSPVAAAVVGLDRRFLRANAAMEQFTGYSADELLTMTFLELTRPDERKADAAGIASLMAGASHEFTREKRYLRKDGREVWGLISARVARDEAGAPLFLLPVIVDIDARKRVEEALRESDEHLRTVFTAAREGIMLQERDGRVRAWNTAAEVVFGVAESEIVGETVLGRDWPTVHEDGTPWPPEEFPSLKTLATGEPQHDVVMGVARDDELRLISINSEPVFSADEAGPSSAVVTFSDITERKRTERLLAAPAEILGIIAAAASVRETAAGVAAALKRATGFDAVGLRLKQDDDYPFIGSLGYTDEFLAAENVLTERSPDNELCRNADGSINLECTCGLVISGATDPANPLFTAGGSAWTNDSLPILDIPPDEDPRLHPRNRCIHVGFRSLALVPLRAGEEILGLLHLGDRRTDRFTTESIAFFEGLGASIGVAIQAKQAGEEIKKLNEQLSYRLMDRNAQLDMANQELESYAYAVSHDVRTPLRAIDGFSATVIEDEGDRLSPGAVDDLRRVRAAAQEMARLLDDLLGFSNMTHRDLLRRSVDVSALATEVAGELAADDATPRVQVSIEPGLVAEADPTLLRMILRELLGNAWKFTSKHDGAQVEVGALDDGGQLAFYVRDDGAGFDATFAKHLFGLFQRMHPRGTFSGDGVGLATVQRLVRRHGGRVWAESEVEKGTTVYFTLPPEAATAD